MDADLDQNHSTPIGASAMPAQAASPSRAEFDQFIYTVSHDLKAPLVTLQGFASLIEHDLSAGRTDRLNEFVEQIRGGVNQMARLIDDLLVLSRIGRKTRPAEPVDLADLSRKILRLHQHELAAGAIETDVQAQIPAITVDKERIADVIERLISNAILHGRASADPRFHIGGELTHGEFRFYVRDNGPGIAPGDHGKIFDLFERLDPATPGTGAGLAIVRRSLEVLGGRAWVESVPGQGATFWLAFPEQMLSGRPQRPEETTPR